MPRVLEVFEYAMPIIIAVAAAAPVANSPSGEPPALSRTVTWNAADALFFAASVAVHMTVVVPIAKVEPEGGLQAAATCPSTRSLAETEYVATAPDEPVASIVMFGSAEIAGGVVSWTLTLKVAGVAALPCESVAEQVTVVTPIANVEPDAGAHAAAPAPSTRSVAVMV